MASPPSVAPRQRHECEQAQRDEERALTEPGSHPACVREDGGHEIAGSQQVLARRRIVEAGSASRVNQQVERRQQLKRRQRTDQGKEHHRLNQRRPGPASSGRRALEAAKEHRCDGDAHVHAALDESGQHLQHEHGDQRRMGPQGRTSGRTKCQGEREREPGVAEQHDEVAQIEFRGDRAAQHDAGGGRHPRHATDPKLGDTTRTPPLP